MVRHEEENLQIQIANYLNLKYPNVLFHSDVGSGVRLTMNQAARQKRLNVGRRGWPDLAIMKPKHGYYGLFIELKKEKERIFAGNRAKNRFKSLDKLEYCSEHLMEQADVLFLLNKAGYLALFCIGFDETIKLIDNYLGEEPWVYGREKERG